METIIYRVEDVERDREAVQQAGQVLRRGGLVGMPTETVYGLAADATQPEAVRHIFEAKGRPQDNPLIVHIADFEQVERYTQDISEDAWRLMRTYWPGPMTVILKKRDIIPEVVSCGLDTIGLRMPSHPVARALIRASGTALAAPSANTSGRPSTTTAQHVYEDLHGRIDMILDGGPCEIGVESTVIDMSGEVPTLLRPGGISLEQLRAVLPQVQVDKCIYSTVAGDKQVRSPGMKYKHYAPKAPVTILLGTDEAIRDYVWEKLKTSRARGEKVGVLCYSETTGDYTPYENAVVLPLGSRYSKEDIAHHLFAQLRAFDETGVKEIYANCPDSAGLGLAVVNRLSKAAGFHILELSHT